MSDMSDSKLVKKEETKIVKQETIGFAIQSNNINEKAVERLKESGQSTTPKVGVYPTLPFLK